MAHYPIFFWQSARRKMGHGCGICLPVWLRPVYGAEESYQSWQS